MGKFPPDKLIGGEEFFVPHPTPSSKSEALKLAKELRKKRAWNLKTRKPLKAKIKARVYKWGDGWVVYINHDTD